MDPALYSENKSAEWRAARKVMASLFWDERGIIFIDYLEMGKSPIALWESLKTEIAKKTAPYEVEENALSSKQCTVSQVVGYDGKIARIGLRIAFNPPHRILQI